MDLFRLVSRVAVATLLLAAVSCSGKPAATKSSGEICDQFGFAQVADRYVVRNNRFGEQGGWQCVTPNGTGFAITQLAGVDPSGRAIGFPSVLFGCSYDLCSPDKQLPKRVNEIHNATAQVRYKYVDRGSWDAVAIMDLDPVVASSLDPKTEIIIYPSTRGLPAPKPEDVRPDITLSGHVWQVRQLGGAEVNGANQVAYTSATPIVDLEINIVDFINDARSRNLIKDDWYLNSLQAGFQCRSGCLDLAVASFSTTLN